MYSIMSSTLHSRILHSASTVFVETDSPLCSRSTVPPLTCSPNSFSLNLSVYVVAPLAFIVLHRGSYEIIAISPLHTTIMTV